MLTCSNTFAINVLLTNADGYKSAYIQELYTLLKTEGHNVLVSAPYIGQGEASAAIDTSDDVIRVSQSYSSDEIYSVSSTPTTAMLYGIDVLAKHHWGSKPHLIIAGPNLGLHTGIDALHSGVVGAAVTALARGIPAIAINVEPEPSADEELASHNAVLKVVPIIRELASYEKILPEGYGLNINVPASAKPYKNSKIYMLTDVGHFSYRVPMFANDASDTFVRVKYTSYNAFSVFNNDGQQAFKHSEGYEAANGKITISPFTKFGEVNDSSTYNNAKAMLESHLNQIL